MSWSGVKILVIDTRDSVFAQLLNTSDTVDAACSGYQRQEDSLIVITIILFCNLLIS